MTRFTILQPPTLLCLLAAALLSACGGGGGGGSSSNNNSGPDTTVSGTAAAGAPISGFAAVKDSADTVRTAAINAGGSYSLDTEGLDAPFILYATGVAGGKAYTLYSAGTENDVGKTVNITPFTDLVLGNVAGSDGEEFFNTPDYNKITDSALSNEKAALATRLVPMLDSLGISTDVDLVNEAFDADHTGQDALLDFVKVEVDPSTDSATLTNRLDENQTITDDLTTTGETTTLDTSVDLGVTQTELQALAERLKDFQALIESGVPTSTEVEPYLHTDILFEGVSQSYFLNLFTSSDTQDRDDAREFARELADFSLISIDTSSSPMTATLDIGMSTWFKMRYADNTWKLYGNQNKWEAWVEPNANNNNGTRDVNIDTNASDNAGLYGNNDYIIINGTLADTAELGGFSGVRLSNGDLFLTKSNSDYSAKLYPTDAEIDQLSLDEPYTMTRWTDPNGNTSVDTNGNLANTNDDVQKESYTAYLRVPPYKSGEFIDFPEITNPTETEFSNFSGGDLSVEWTTVDTLQSYEATVALIYGDGTYDEFSEKLTNDASSVTISAPADENKTTVSSRRLEVSFEGPQNRDYNAVLSK